jgi:hypothetical protein
VDSTAPLALHERTVSMHADESITPPAAGPEQPQRCGVGSAEAAAQHGLLFLSVFAYPGALGCAIPARGLTTFPRFQSEDRRNPRPKLRRILSLSGTQRRPSTVQQGCVFPIPLYTKRTHVMPGIQISWVHTAQAVALCVLMVSEPLDPRRTRCERAARCPCTAGGFVARLVARPAERVCRASALRC